MGGITTLGCLGGLFGVWLLAARRDGHLIRHALNATLLALISSGFFIMVDPPEGEDHLALRALGVAGICIVAACLAKSYLTTRMVIDQPGGGA